MDTTIPSVAKSLPPEDELLPEYTWISSVKKLDCFLWGGVQEDFEVTEE